MFHSLEENMHSSFHWNNCFVFSQILLPQVLFRQNFLVFFLCLVMDRQYQFYYFVPLVTFWYLLIYATMALPPRVTQESAQG